MCVCATMKWNYKSTEKRYFKMTFSLKLVRGKFVYSRKITSCRVKLTDEISKCTIYLHCLH